MTDRYETSYYEILTWFNILTDQKLPYKIKRMTAETQLNTMFIK